ncbi:MAG TPA: MMPL family transporter [Candidatus Methylomirabilis sp.]|nr:MMPL family transporter [Candidatus Methylomirabilis sp.]
MTRGNGLVRPPGAQSPSDGGLSIGRTIGRLIAIVARTCGDWPLTTVAISLVLAAISAVYAVHTLTFVSDPLRLLPQKESYVVRLKEYQREFGQLNDVVIVVESPTPDRSKAYAMRLTRELRAAGLGALPVTYRVDPAFFDRRGLLYLSIDDLTMLRDRLFDYQDFIEGYAAHPTLPQLLEGLNQQIANQMVLGLFDIGLGSGRPTDLRFLESTIDQISGRLDGETAYTSPWSTAFSVGRFDDPDAGYFFSSDRHWLFMLVQDDGDYRERRQSLATMRGVIARLKGEFPDVHGGVTGGPAIANDEMTTALDDSKLATMLAFGLTLGLLVAGFRRVLAPLLMLGTLAVSLAWSLGIISLVVGHLSIFSVTFISIVVGIGTDYGIYFLYRYDEELRIAPVLHRALRRTGERAGPGMLLSALTAAGAFVVLMLTDFQGIREFGFVSASAILLTFVAMVTLFPALLALDRRRPARAGMELLAPRSVPEATWLVRIIQYRKTIVAGGLALTAFAVWGAVQVDFDYNMLKLQARGVESVALEEQILAKAGRSGFAALATAPTLGELERKRDAFAALPSVSKVESVLMLTPDRQAEKIKLIKQFAPLVEGVHVGTASGVQPADLRAPLETLRRRLRLAEEGGDEARRVVGPVQAKLGALLDKLAHADPRRAGPELEKLQERMAGDFASKLTTFQKNLDPRPVEPGDAPPELRRNYVGTSGRYLLRVHPAVDIWQQAGAERFVSDLRKVDPDVSGPPITSFEAIRFIRHGYFQGTLYALLLVAAVTGLVLRSVRSTALALAPLVLGVLWTIGFMHVFDLSFNLANVWALPLIIGTAAEFGLNMFVRFQEGRDTGGPWLAQSTVMAVVLNGFTTMVGFGSLLVAHHRGIFGLGLLLTIGMIASLLASLFVLPALLRIVYGPAIPFPVPASGAVPGGDGGAATPLGRAAADVVVR